MTFGISPVDVMEEEKGRNKGADKHSNQFSYGKTKNVEAPVAPRPNTSAMAPTPSPLREVVSEDNSPAKKGESGSDWLSNSVDHDDVTETNRELTKFSDLNKQS